jgi:tRNA-splicing ligase RtcB
MYVPGQSELGKKYWSAMAAAANYAWCNRQVITHFVRKTFKRLFPASEVELLYDVSHNIAKIEEHTVQGRRRTLLVHRKGATRAFPPGHEHTPRAYAASGQPVLIPGSMGTSSYILAGAQGSMEQAFGSCCHGAGRQMSRQSAIQTFKGDRLRAELKAQGITVRGSTKGLVEEAPGAYKDVDEVIRTVAEAGLAVPVARCLPLGVLKG